ncbi:MAG: Uma2 family endonuclease [Gemmataceae bacterium]
MSVVVTGTAPAVDRKDPTQRLWSADEFSRMRELSLFAERDLLLDDGQLLEHFADGTSQAVVFTQAEFCQLWDANFFRDQRVQLIGGEIVQESFMNPQHAVCIRLATLVLERVFGVGYDVRPQLPLDLTPTNRPHPDLAVVTGSPRDYAVKHPTTAVLAVEVSDSTLEEDTHTKMSLYAAAGIAE